MVDKGNPLMVTNSTATAVADDVKHTVRRQLSTASAYAGTFKRIEIDFSNGILTLRGQLPSYYLKQVLQTLIGNVEGVDQVRNQVEVRKPRPRQIETVNELANPWS